MPSVSITTISAIQRPLRSHQVGDGCKRFYYLAAEYMECGNGNAGIICSLGQ